MLGNNNSVNEGIYFSAYTSLSPGLVSVSADSVLLMQYKCLKNEYTGIRALFKIISHLKKNQLNRNKLQLSDFLI